MALSLGITCGNAIPGGWSGFILEEELWDQRDNSIKGTNEEELRRFILFVYCLFSLF